MGMYDVTYAENGTNDRMRQEQMFGHFVKYCREVEGNICLTSTQSIDHTKMGRFLQPCTNILGHTSQLRPLI